MRNLKLYLETSVWNFVLTEDAPEKRDVTVEFFKKVEQGEYDVFISQTVLNEIDKASETKKSQLM